MLDRQLQEALAHHRAGQLAQAETLYRQILAASPDHPTALYLLGLVACQAGHYEDALSLTARAIHLNPTAEAHFTQGNAFCGLHQYEQAVAAYDQAVHLDPTHAFAHVNRAIALHALGQYQDALESSDRALVLNPAFAEAHFNRGNALHALGQYNAAVESYDHALQNNPAYADAYFNRGIALHALNHHQSAIASYDHALRLNPSHADAYQNRGIAHHTLLDYAAALADFDRAIALRPDFSDAHNNRASALLALEQIQPALESFNTAARLNPAHEWLPGMRLYIRRLLCDWDHIESETRDLEAAIQRGERAAMPFAILALSDSPAIHRQAAEIYVRDRFPTHAPPLPPIPPSGRIRIGYFSADFESHATSYLMAELFERHDRARFEIFAFSFGPDSADPMRHRIAAAMDHFLDVRTLSDQAIAQLARTHHIDIAVDLKGFTRESRPGIFAHRAAPIQINYLGYPGTMGAPFIDYLIADRIVIPESAQPHYSEKILYLPNTYQPNPSHPGCPVDEAGCPIHAASSHEWDPSTRRAAEFPTDPGCPIHAVPSHGWGLTTPRVAHALPETAFVFCCFNNAYKITPAVFDSWMQILAAVPTSVLWLLENNPQASANLRREAVRRTIDPARLIFAAPVPHAEHLARLALANLFLDTFPYTAHTTASDALSVGLPVLTRIGESFPSRVAASLLRAIHLPELITTTPAGYRHLAITLAHDAPRYQTLRTRLQHNLTTTPLFNSPLFTRDLESLYLTLRPTLDDRPARTAVTS